MPKFLPIQLDAVGADAKSVYADVDVALGRVPNFIKTMAHSPKYLKPVAELYKEVFSADSSLSDKIRYLAILKTAKVENCKSAVEQFTPLAKGAGYTDEQLEAMGEYTESELFDYYEKDVLRLVEEVLSDPGNISHVDFWTQLNNHFSSDQIVELVTLIGFASLVNRFNLSLEVEPDFQPVAE
jgi:alkylhydroperoxidase family enzyme